MRPPAGTTVVVGALTVLTLAACSGDDDSAGDGPTTTTSGSPVSSDGAASTSPSDLTAPAPTDPRVTSEPVDPTDPPLTTFAVVEVPETGVPGLDSDDSFCAAWSRFGGSWQVIQVAANFAPDPAVAPTMEVTASPVVVAAYDAMFAAWPDELVGERDAVADGFFGPLERRAATALEALVGAGATPDQLDSLRVAWEAALAARVPDDPVVSPELDDDLQALVDQAATSFDGQLVGFVDDPTMRITVETPLTDVYLSTACPDQGALTGGEVDVG